MDRVVKALAPGSLVDVIDDKGSEFGTAYFNPHSLIAARLLSPKPGAKIDTEFFRSRIERARNLRDVIVKTPYYRLLNADADFCPGLIVDRFDNVLVVQSGTAGMDALQPHWLEALQSEFRPRAIVLKSDSPARTHEGLKDDVRLLHGQLDAPAFVQEAGVRHEIDAMSGQKTGWFFDQRDNRAFLIALAVGGALLDAFSYTGALGLGALKAGALSATFLDASQGALDLASTNARQNSLAENAEFRRCDAMVELEEMGPTGEAFEVVSCDPPPFVKARKDLESGARGYRKLARLSAPLVKRGGFLCISSCSHGIDVDRFQSECASGIAKSSRSAKLIRSSGASPDHPIHPMLPESAYLKSLIYQLD